MPLGRGDDTLQQVDVRLVAVAFVALVAAIVQGWPWLVPSAVALVGGTYAVELAMDDAPLDVAVPIVAVGLLLAAELAYWSLDERERSRESRVTISVGSRTSQGSGSRRFSLRPCSWCSRERRPDARARRRGARRGRGSAGAAGGDRLRPGRGPTEQPAGRASAVAALGAAERIESTTILLRGARAEIRPERAGGSPLDGALLSARDRVRRLLVQRLCDRGRPASSARARITTSRGYTPSVTWYRVACLDVFRGLHPCAVQMDATAEHGVRRRPARLEEASGPEPPVDPDRVQLGLAQPLRASDAAASWAVTGVELPRTKSRACRRPASPTASNCSTVTMLRGAG